MMCIKHIFRKRSIKTIGDEMIFSIAENLNSKYQQKPHLHILLAALFYFNGSKNIIDEYESLKSRVRTYKEYNGFNGDISLLNVVYQINMDCVFLNNPDIYIIDKAIEYFNKQNFDFQILTDLPDVKSNLMERIDQKQENPTVIVDRIILSSKKIKQDDTYFLSNYIPSNVHHYIKNSRYSFLFENYEY